MFELLKVSESVPPTNPETPPVLDVVLPIDDACERDLVRCNVTFCDFVIVDTLVCSTAVELELVTLSIVLNLVRFASKAVFDGSSAVTTRGVAPNTAPNFLVDLMRRILCARSRIFVVGGGASYCKA